MLLHQNGPEHGPQGEATSGKRLTGLADAVTRHAGWECASFHTPGHKGRPPGGARSAIDENRWTHDLTELPGLDDLSCPRGVLAELEARAAAIWGARTSMISVNGASAGLAATMLVLASRGSTVLIPRNAHRSIIHGLVLSGLFPIWYEPVWDDEWGLWGSVSATTVERLIERYGAELSGLVVVSPTYAGAISDIKAISELCRKAGVPLIVDEAHGAHFIPDTVMPPSAVGFADIVVHSLHKTLPALTQTGSLHVGRQSVFDADYVRSALQLLMSSSPSYLLMTSIEQAFRQLEPEKTAESLVALEAFSRRIAARISELQALKLYTAPTSQDPAHILVGLPGRIPEELYNFLAERGIFAEAILGNGVLFMLGLGTSADDVQVLLTALSDFDKHIEDEPATGSAFAGVHGPARRPAEPVQILSPRQAYLMPSELVALNDSVGRISQVTIAPCPPGTSVITAGQRVPEEILDCTNLQSIRVVIE